MNIVRTGKDYFRKLLRLRGPPHSIAMGAAGSDVAIKSASVALMNSNLNRIPFLIDLSRRTIGVIRLNMIIGGFFVVAGMSLGAMGKINPGIAAPASFSATTSRKPDPMITLCDFFSCFSSSFFSPERQLTNKKAKARVYRIGFIGFDILVIEYCSLR